MLTGAQPLLVEASYDEDLAAPTAASSTAADAVCQHRTDACMRCVCSHRCCQQRAERLGLKRGDHVDEKQMEARQSSRYKAQQPLPPTKRKPFQPPKPLIKQQSEDGDSKYESLQQQEQQKRGWTVVSLGPSGEFAERKTRESTMPLLQLPPAGRLARLDVAGSLGRGAERMDVEDEANWALPSLSLSPLADAPVSCFPPARPVPTVIALPSAPSTAPSAVARSGLFDAYAAQPPPQQQSPQPAWHSATSQPRAPWMRVSDIGRQHSNAPAPRDRSSNPFTPSPVAAYRLPVTHPTHQLEADIKLPLSSDNAAAVVPSRTASIAPSRTASRFSHYRYGATGDNAALKGVNTDMRPKPWRHSALATASLDSTRQRSCNAMSQRVHAAANDFADTYDDRQDVEMSARQVGEVMDEAPATIAPTEYRDCRRRERSPLSRSDYRHEAAYSAQPARYSGYEGKRSRRAERRDGDLYYDDEQRDGGQEADWDHHYYSAHNERWEEREQREDRNESLFRRYTFRGAGRGSPYPTTRYEADSPPRSHSYHRSEERDLSRREDGGGGRRGADSGRL